MADKKKSTKLEFDVEKSKKGHNVTHTYEVSDDPNYPIPAPWEKYHGAHTDEDRSGQGPRERRKEDRRKADERTTETRRKLGDRRGNYEVTFVEPTQEVKEHYKKGGFIDLGGSKNRTTDAGIIRNNLLTNPHNADNFVLEEVQEMRKAREVARRGGEFRSKIKGKRGGLLGLGLAILGAGMAAKKAYAESEEKK